MDGLENHILVRALEALPTAVAIVDPGLRVRYLNGAAGRLFDVKDPEATRRKVIGDAIGCSSALSAEKGCGFGPKCGTCRLRRSAKDGLGGRKVERRRSNLVVQRGAQELGIDILITSAPFEAEEAGWAIVSIEDVSDLVELRRILPVCAWCGAVRDGEDYWSSVHKYLERHHNLDISHGICDACLEKHYPEDEEDEDVRPTPPAPRAGTH